MPATIHNATHTVKYRSKKPIAGAAPPATAVVGIVVMEFVSKIKLFGDDRRLANLLDFLLNHIFVEHGDWQTDESVHPGHDLFEDLFKGGALFVVSAFHRSGVFKSPMCCRRVAWPVWASFAGGVVTHRDDEIHEW